MNDADKVSGSIKYQLLAAFSANLVSLGAGSGVGWLSPALPILQSNQSPLGSRALTVNEVGWVGSITSLGAILGNLIVGFFITKIGSRSMIIFLAVPLLISWLLIYFGTQAIHLCAARFLSGVAGGGSQTGTIMYIAEIADNNIRGRCGLLYPLCRRLGILFAYLVVSYFDYFKLALFFIGIAVPFFGIFLLLPSTPQYLLKNNKIEKAEKSLRFYKRYKGDGSSELYASVLDQMKIVSESVNEEPKLGFSDIVESRKSIVQAAVLAFLNQISGSYTFITYGTSIFEKSGTKISKEAATTVLGVAQLLGPIIASQLIDGKGRKFLLILSLSGCVIFHSLLIVFLQLNSSGFDVTTFHWMPVACITLVVLSSALGIGPVMFICIAESFAVKMRPFGMTFGNLSLNVLAFVFVKAFPILVEVIELKGCLLICAISCALGIVYIALYVEETKGKDLNAVSFRS